MESSDQGVGRARNESPIVNLIYDMVAAFRLVTPLVEVHRHGRIRGLQSFDQSTRP